MIYLIVTEIREWSVIGDFLLYNINVNVKYNFIHIRQYNIAKTK